MRDKDKEVREKIGELLVAHGWGNETAKQLAAWDPYDQNASSPFFDPEWMFDISDGFDVVIGNPPYITYHGRRRTIIKNEELDFFKNNYDCVFEKKKDGKYNAAMFFIERFSKLSNSTGLFCCITDISFYEHFYQGLKKYLLENTAISIIVNGLSSFENVASGQLIIIAPRAINKAKALNNFIRVHNEGFDSIPIRIKQQQWYNTEKQYQFFIPEENLDTIYQKFEQSNKPLEFYFPNKLIRTGESVGVKEHGFVTDNDIENKKIIIYKYLEGSKSVPSKFCSPVPTRYFRFDVDLLNQKNEAYRKDAVKHKRKNPKVLGIGDELAFKNPKLLIRQSCDHLCCTYTEKPYVFNRSYYSISNVNSSGKSKFNLLFVLALLNSKLFTFYAKKKRVIRMEKGKQPQIRLKDIKTLPIKVVEEKQQPFITIVDNILSLKAKNAKAYTGALEKQLDEMVYKLYELTDDEIAIVEGK
nr:hypothetical protein [Bacteroidota bacterium]